MDGQTRKRNKSKRRLIENSRTMEAYDAEFARRQKLLYFRTCVVCRKQDYFMKACSQCQLTCCCHGDCLSKHGSKDNQRYICVINFIFNGVRKLIPPPVKDTLFKLGFSEISLRMSSIPRREVYELLGDTRSVILLVVTLARIAGTVLEFMIQNINGFSAILTVIPPAGSLPAADVVCCKRVLQSFPPFTFILLRNSRWNNHLDAQTAAVEIPDFNCITRLENTDDIVRDIPPEDAVAVLRNLMTHISTDNS